MLVTYLPIAFSQTIITKKPLIYVVNLKIEHKRETNTCNLNPTNQTKILLINQITYDWASF